MLRAIGKIFLLHQALLSISGIDATRIVQHPQDRVLFTSSIDEDVSFVCKVELAYLGINWRVNGSVITDPSFSTTRYVDNNVYVDTLTFRARRNYNTTVVQCFANGDGYVESKSASLRYQGILAAPNNITVQNGIRSITISWSAPFSLDVSEVDPDIWYTVLISNVTDEDHPTAVPCTDCHSLTQTHYTFSPDLPSPCHKYTFTVIPQNGVGNGTWSERIMGHHTKVPPGINTSEVNITLSKQGTAIYTVSITAPPLNTGRTVLCFGERPDHFKVYYVSEQKHCSGFSSYASNPAAMETSNAWLINSTANLRVNCNYTLHITTCNEAGETNSTGRLLISTTVILANVQHWNDGLNITCIFSNTLSEKCYVQIVTDAVSGFHEGEYLEGEDRASHSFTGLWPGTYTVLVYGMDREEVFISLPDGPDYVSVVSVGGPQETPVPHVPTGILTSSTTSDTTSSVLCYKGLGIGIGSGVMTTILVIVIVIIIKYIVEKSQKKKAKASLNVDQDTRVPMENNVAYELHAPLSQRLPPRDTATHTINPVCEEARVPMEKNVAYELHAPLSQRAPPRDSAA